MSFKRNEMLFKNRITKIDNDNVVTLTNDERDMVSRLKIKNHMFMANFFICDQCIVGIQYVYENAVHNFGRKTDEAWRGFCTGKKAYDLRAEPYSREVLLY